MASKRGKKNILASNPGFQGVTLREENAGRKHVEPHAILRLQHLQRLAIWAARKGSMSPLAAHYGRLLAAHAQREGIPLDRSIASCQRCETIFQPGYNCTIKLEKDANGSRYDRKPGILRNNVVYTCHICSHRNLRKGTLKGHVKNLLASRPISKTNLADSTIGKSDKDVIVANLSDRYDGFVCGKPHFDVKCSPEKEVARNILAQDSPMTPSNKASEKKMEEKTAAESIKASNTGHCCCTTRSGKGSMPIRKRRKGWSSLRQIALSSDHMKQQQFDNSAIPFLM
ncbi:hypothetical protein Taro_015902 [Colocasia esculenta]|uniref:Uncharacterized protein n=1 Tax=Colocasia esculenta TaxID=4460 RepID=A0A843UIS9_COLES|nr:hypothetical protein [Colocasia esculenta]